MKAQDQRKTTPSGHDGHGIHLCPKCGWPFPNPHPSAKHRRAHKRVCGKIEGHKNTLSSVSDDEHLSDEDRPTPSPKVVERSLSGNGSSGFGERSNRSEDEVFSDAVMEFPGTGLSKKNEIPSQMATDLDVKRAKYPADSSQMQNQAPENGLSTRLAQDDVSSLKLDLFGRFNSEAGLKDSIVELRDDGKVPESCPINSETPNAAPNDVDDAMECSIMQIGIESDTKGKAFTEMETNINGSGECKAASDSSVLDHNLLDLGRKNSDPVSRISRSKEEKCNELESYMSSSDLLLEAESFQHKADFIFDAASTEVGPTQEIDVKNNNDLVEGSTTGKANNEDVHVLSVPDGMIVQNDPEMMLQDFKDHKSVKPDLLTVNSSGAVKVEDDFNVPLSNIDACAMECTLNTGGESKPTVEDATVERELNISELKVVCGENLLSDDAEVSRVVTGGEIGLEESLKVCSHEEESPTNPLVSHISSGVKEMTESVASKDASDHAKDQNGTHNTVENERIEMATCEDFTVNTKKASEFAIDSPENEVHSTIITEKLSGHESSEGATDGMSNMNSTVVYESANFSSESRPVNDGKDYILANTEETESQNVDVVLDSSSAGTDMTSMGYSTETHCSLLNPKDKDIQEGIKDVGICMTNEVEMEFVRAISEVANSNQSVQVDCGQKSSGSNKDEPVNEIERDQGNEKFVSATDISLGPFQEVGDTILAKQQPGVPAVEILADSSSQNDSLEGNWGSVSDALAVDAEALPASNDIQKSVVEEETNTGKPTTVSKGHEHFNSDSFEPPSFMTLVEPKDVQNQKDSSPKNPRNLQQPEPASHAAWFPSITHATSDSAGRKKNEEIIAKVTNWSTDKQHTPLKNLLGEANLELKAKSVSPAQDRKDETSAKDREANPEVGLEARTLQQSLKMETAKEWNSPARYPAAIKREKRKLKGRPYWTQFVCCSSVN